MKLLVFAHRLEVGGTQTNAIELAAALQRWHGFEVVLYATPGPLARLAEEMGLRYVPAPDAFRHPSRARARALVRLVREFKPDLVHVWDWWQLLDAYYSVHLGLGVPIVVSDMMMDLTRILPKHAPTTFGTPELVELARAKGRTRAELLLPPVDVEANSPDAVDPSPFQERVGLREHEIALVTVSRLASHLKGESLRRSIDVVRVHGRTLPLHLIIVGNGGARAELQELARSTNKELGRTAVTLTGALVDPRPAYAAAGIVIGMGGSSLRGLAFGKPLIVVGEHGFAEVFDRSTAEHFYHRGMYGVGSGEADAPRLAACVTRLLSRRDDFADLGAFGRSFVVARFALEVLSQKFADVCRETLRAPVSRSAAVADGLRTAFVYVRERRFLLPSRDLMPQDEVADTQSRPIATPGAETGS
jgi:glycosyltransferase involved in cell wall biosynthesis